MRALLLLFSLTGVLRADEDVPLPRPRPSQEEIDQDTANRDALEAGDHPPPDGDGEEGDKDPTEPEGEEPEPGAAPGAGTGWPAWGGGAGSNSGPSGSGSGSGSATGTKAGAAKSAASNKAGKKKSAAASKAAAKMAETMKQFNKNANANLGGFGGPGAAAKAAGALGPRTPGPGGAAPAGFATAGPGASAASVKDVASWMGPYASLVSSRGLVAERAPDGGVRFRRKDGSPASAQEIAELKAAAAKEPGALTKYPDFFSAISRQDYGRLRDEYEKNPDRPVFKDVDMTKDERKDLVWNRSCDKLSGDCNPHADEQGYKKNDFVKPKAAKSMWDKLLSMMGDDEEKAEEKAKPAGRPRPTVPDELVEEERAAASPAAARAAAERRAAAAAEAPKSAPARMLARTAEVLGFSAAPGQKRAHWGWLIGLLGLAAVLGARKLLG